jgi:hypothetical protein
MAKKREQSKKQTIMEKRPIEKAPSMKLVTPGLSIMVQGKEGPITESELPEAREFGAKFAAQLSIKPDS